MDMIVVIPQRSYKRLHQVCDEANPTYFWLKNGAAMPLGEKEEVHVLCNGERGRLLMNLAESKCPELVSQMRLIPEPAC